MRTNWGQHEMDRVKFTWGTYGKCGTLPKRRVPLDEMSTQHVIAILDTQHHISEGVRQLFITELDYRAAKELYIGDTDDE